MNPSLQWNHSKSSWNLSKRSVTKLLRQRPNGRLRFHTTSLVVCLDRPPFSAAEIDTFDSTKTNIKINRKYITDYTFLLLKEKPSETHSVAAGHLEAEMGHAIVEQMFQYSEEPFFRRLRFYGGGCTRVSLEKLTYRFITPPFSRRARWRVSLDWPKKTRYSNRGWCVG